MQPEGGSTQQTRLPKPAERAPAAPPAGAQGGRGLPEETSSARRGAWWDDAEGGDVKAASRASAITPRPTGRGSSLGASFNFLSNILSGGVLGLPFCFQRCGLGLGGVLLAAVLATQTFTLRQLLYASEVHGRGSYEELAEAALGHLARPACLACILCLQFGCLVAYLAILADLVSATVSPIIPPGAEVGRSEYMAAIVLGVLLPLCLLVRSEEALSRTSIFSVIFLCGFTAATLCLAAVPERGVTPAEMQWWRPQGVALSLPVLVFALAGHSAFFPCISAMRSPTLRRADGVLSSTMRWAGAVYAAVGVAGYAAFRERTAGNLLRNFGAMAQLPGRRAAAVRHLKLGFAFSVAGAVPVTVLPVREAVLAALSGGVGGGEEVGPLRHAAVNALIMCITLLLAVLIPNVEFVFALTGATASVMLAYLFPAAIFLSTQRQLAPPPADARHWQGRTATGKDAEETRAPAGDAEAEQRCAEAGNDAACAELELLGCLAGAPARALSWALLVFGVAAMVLCTAATLRAVSDEAAVVSVAQQLVIKSEAAVIAAQALGKATQAACTLSGIGASAAASCQPATGVDTTAQLVLPGGAARAAPTAGADRAAAVEEDLALAVEQAEEAGRRGGVAASVLQAANAAAHGLAAGAAGEQPAGTNVSAAADAALATAGAVADATVIAVRDAVATLDPMLAARAKELAAALGAAEHVEAALAVAQEAEPSIAQLKAATASVPGSGLADSYTWEDAVTLWDEGDGAAAAAMLFPRDQGAPPAAAGDDIAEVRALPLPAADAALANNTRGFGDLLLSRLGAAGNHTANATTTATNGLHHTTRL